jgi:hypothetical protein
MGHSLQGAPKIASCLQRPESDGWPSKRRPSRWTNSGHASAPNQISGPNLECLYLRDVALGATAGLQDGFYVERGSCPWLTSGSQFQSCDHGRDFDLSGPDHPYLIVQRQFEDDDGGVCYIETHDRDTYAGHFRLKLIEFTATRLAFEIARTDHKYVEATYELDAKRFGEVQRIVHIIFGV